VDTVGKALWEAAANPRLRIPKLDAVSSADLDRAIADVLHRELDNLWNAGWLPYDLVQVIGRHDDERAVSMLVDAIASEVERYPEATIHPRWRDQLTEIEATVWWDREKPHVDEWSRKHIELRQDAVEIVVALLSRLLLLPRLQNILPRPGSAAIEITHVGVSSKVLNRVRGLLAKAESSQFPEEAEALSAKAQELMNRHAFERAAIDADAHVPQTATSRRMWLDKSYFDGKAQLVHVVAKANRSRAVVYGNIGFVALVGDEMDLEIVELLSTSLLVQATRAMVAAGSGASKGAEARSRGYRKSFLFSYAHRIGERLEAATEVHASDDRLLPVLSERKQAVDVLFETLFTKTKAKSVTVRSEAGWDAGRSAANSANLTVNRAALGGGPAT
jgi:hypothetical protein